MADNDTPKQLRIKIQEVVRAIGAAHHLVAFTGAGISVESGIPPFRGSNGLWSSYDPKYLELSYFQRHPEKCWRILKSIFYAHFAEARPNNAHRVLVQMEEQGLLKAVITQNIDNLHQIAGSKRVIEFHGNTRNLQCLSCGEITSADPEVIEILPPICRCGGILKPDCIFFGETIPQVAWAQARAEIEAADAVLIVGSTGEVYPAASLPYQAAERGAQILEINPQESNFTRAITGVFVALPADGAMKQIGDLLNCGTS